MHLWHARIMCMCICKHAFMHMHVRTRKRVRASDGVGVHACTRTPHVPRHGCVCVRARTHAGGRGRETRKREDDLELSGQVLNKAALDVAKQVAVREAHSTPAREQALGRKHSKGYESIARECDNAHEWECAEQRAHNTGPQPMRIAGNDRFHADEVRIKNIREGDDQDINYRFPREGTYPNRDGSKPLNADKAAKDADDADTNAKAAWAAAYVRDVRQGGGGDEEKGEEVADDAPRYRWVHHRNMVCLLPPSLSPTHPPTLPPSLHAVWSFGAREWSLCERVCNAYRHRTALAKVSLYIE